MIYYLNILFKYNLNINEPLEKEIRNPFTIVLKV